MWKFREFATGTASVRTSLDAVFGRMDATAFGGDLLRTRLATWILLVGIGVLACVARRPGTFWYADFHAEDGAIFFSGAFNLGLLGSLLETYAGYHHTLSRLVAWFNVTLLPLERVPLGFALSSSVLASLAISTFYLKGFRHIIPSDAWRFLTVVVLFLAPNADNLALVLGIHWYALFWLCLCLFIRSPKTWGGGAMMAGVGLLCVFSSPGAVLLLPFLLLRTITAKSGVERLWSGTWTVGVTMVIARYLGSKLFGGTAADLPSLLSPSETLLALVNATSLGWLATALLGGWATPMRLETINPRWAWLVAGLIAGGVMAFLWVRRRNPTAILPSIVWISLGAGMVAMLALRPAFLRDFLEFETLYQVRYFTVPTLLLFGAIAVMACPARPWAFSRSWSSGAIAVAWFLCLTHFAWHAPLWHSEESHFIRIVPAIREMERRLELGRPAEHLRLRSGPLQITITRWGDRVVSDPVSVKHFLIEAEELGGGRFRSPWLGTFDAHNWPEITHPFLGKVTALRVESGRYWFDAGDGVRFWTAPGIYPETLHEWIGDDGRYRIYEDGGRLWILGNDGRWYTPDDQGRFWTVGHNNTWSWVRELP